MPKPSIHPLTRYYKQLEHDYTQAARLLAKLRSNDECGQNDTLIKAQEHVLSVARLAHMRSIGRSDYLLNRYDRTIYESLAHLPPVKVDGVQYKG